MCTPPQRALAQNLLVLDYTFLICSSTSLARARLPVGVDALAQAPVTTWGVARRGAQWVAAALDAIENTALLSVLRGLWFSMPEICARFVRRHF